MPKTLRDKWCLRKVFLDDSFVRFFQGVDVPRLLGLGPALSNDPQQESLLDFSFEASQWEGARPKPTPDKTWPPMSIELGAKLFESWVRENVPPEVLKLVVMQCVQFVDLDSI
jgi:hypothetical protein